MELFSDFVTCQRREVVVKTLKEFCIENELDPTYISKIERGVTPVPTDSGFLKKYAKCLKLDKKQEEEFYSIVRKDAGKVYVDMSDDDFLKMCLNSSLVFHWKEQGLYADEALEKTKRVAQHLKNS